MKLLMWVVVFGVFGGVGGCGRYAGVQAALVAQGREGLQRVEAARRQDSAAVALHLLERRRRLDAAFDADVRARATVDAGWVIEARRAYAIGVDGLAEARAEQGRADAIARDNARSADEALLVLERMLKTQQQLGTEVLP